MGRLIILTLIFYAAFTVSRLLLKLFSGKWVKSTGDGRKKPDIPPWGEEDIEDADFEEIE